MAINISYNNKFLPVLAGDVNKNLKRFPSQFLAHIHGYIKCGGAQHYFNICMGNIRRIKNNAKHLLT